MQPPGCPSLSSRLRALPLPPVSCRAAHTAQATNPTSHRRQSPVWASVPLAAGNGRSLLHGSGPFDRRCGVSATGFDGDGGAGVPSVATAKEAVELGLKTLEAGDVEAALGLFNRAMDFGPNQEEATAAKYNAACCLAKLKRWKEAADGVVEVVNDYNLKLKVAMEDGDLEELRDTREWREALAMMKGGLTEEQRVKLRAETKAPFRLPRLYLFGGLLAGAGFGLLIILARLAAALKGGEGAPDLQESITNLGINLAAVVVLGFLFYRDVSQSDKDAAVTAREEALGALQVRTAASRVMPLARLRGTVRPVVVAGTKSQIARVLKAARPLREELQDRGVCVIPVITTDAAEPADKIKALKQKLQSNGGNSDAGKGFAEEVEVKQGDGKWEVSPHNMDEWREWMEEQKEFAGAKGSNFYVQVQLDGTVRSSGSGAPPWQELVQNLPTMDSVMTKFGDNIGPTV
ncbi:unnamed protein product [Ostreobium quekettii]|uniref:Uncharacterized protein n=1 Tax=Ostreobium quekettii TaxID=121088 RepID=A0A8S1ING4_9CHLO|nr:unnamed protein product [Ostreobium quekettii]|eukprot:evm.model.scf_503.1 EVM.evm.TU.scf_503.1   scf_503:5801-10009(+)